MEWKKERNKGKGTKKRKRKEKEKKERNRKKRVKEWNGKKKGIKAKEQRKEKEKKKKRKRKEKEKIKITATFCCSEFGTVKMIARNEGGVEMPITSSSGSQAVFCGQHVSLILTGLDQVQVTAVVPDQYSGALIFKV